MLKEQFTILLADDKYMPRKLLAERISQLSNVGEVAQFADGMSAKRYLLEHKVDMVITDIMMPLMDGLELAAFMHEFDPFCPLVIISGYSEFEYAQKAIRYGVQEYLLKPVQVRQVFEVMEKGLKQICSRREGLQTQLTSKDEEMEQQLFRCFMNGEETEDLKEAIQQIVSCQGTAVRISTEEEKGSNIQKHSLIYKNILQDALPGWKVLRLRFSLGRYDYLLMPAQYAAHRSLSAAPEYLNRIMTPSVDWKVIGMINNSQELMSLAAVIRGEEGHELIGKACRYMQEHLHEPITQEDVADYVLLSSSYFGQLFKRVMGIGYNKYLTELRISQARRLLGKNLPIKEIALAVGFNDAKYFTDVFNKTTGYVPSEYRRALLNGTISQDEMI